MTQLTYSEHQAQQVALFHAAGGRDYGQQWGAPSLDRFRPIRQWIEDAARMNSRWLEIGCGGGRWSREILRHENVTLSAVDAAAEAELLTRAHLGEDARRLVDFRLCPDGQLTHEPGSFDVVFAFDVFVHFPEELFFRYLDSIGHVLRQGGQLFLHYGMRFPESPDWNDGSLCFVYLTRDKLARIAESHGLRATQWEKTYPIGYGSICQAFTRE